MNLMAYDIIFSTNQLKTWIDKVIKSICSIELPYFKYYYIAKRYDDKCYNYYLILTNNKVDDPEPRYTRTSYSGIRKFSIKEIWNEGNFDKVDNNTFKLELVEKQLDCIIYKMIS